MTPTATDFWNVSADKLLSQLETTAAGLKSEEADARLLRYGDNRLKPQARTDFVALLIGQFKSPIILILLFAAGLSFFLHDRTNAAIILAIVLVSGLLGFLQERGATDMVEKLLSMVKIKATVLRDGQAAEIFTEKIVPGDIVIFNAGDLVPADCRLLESKDLFVDEATITGETFPVEKSAGDLPVEAVMAKRTNSLWMGTHVVSGNGKALVVATGKQTMFGAISEKLKLRPPETEFERGIRRFGYFLMEVTLILVVMIFAINVYLARPVLEALLFSLALAVGLTPQLLPAIISINLAQGAKRMAAKKVIVKRLASIENFGSINVLCSDKTGTLTTGTVNLKAALNLAGAASEKASLYAYLNAFYETGFTNPIDEAIRSDRKFDLAGYEKNDEIPYDFTRKILSVLVSKGGERVMISKGALANIINACTWAETDDGKTVEIAAVEDQINQRFEAYSREGLRTLGLAYKNKLSQNLIHKEDEKGMTFLGFLTFVDPLKPNILETIDSLKKLGIALKIITGDNHLVAAAISTQLKLQDPRVLSGAALNQMSDAALVKQVNQIDVFSEVEPNQKERIIIALKKAGNVVGYMGDGINDASALHAADVGLSVDSAADVAKEAADIVLMEKDLEVLVHGVKEGRVTFSNTLKYIFMATSANFGNMFSMAGASLFLSYLPLLPKQILLTNLMTDFPEMAIATDSVDEEMITQPRRMNIQFIRRFMIVFGMISSIFDFLTFGVLLFFLHASQDQFRTGWFIESVVSATLVVLVIRTRKSFFKSMPGKHLFIATVAVVLAAVLLPFTPLARVFGFSALPFPFLLMLGGIVALYIFSAEFAKSIFYKNSKF